MYLAFGSACNVVRCETATDVCCFPGCRRVCRRERCWPTIQSTSQCRLQTPASGRLTRFCGSMSRSLMLLAGDSPTPGTHSLVWHSINSALQLEEEFNRWCVILCTELHSILSSKCFNGYGSLATPEITPYTTNVFLIPCSQRSDFCNAFNEVLWWLAGMWRRAWAFRWLILRPWLRSCPKMTCWMTSHILSLTSSYRCGCPCLADLVHAGNNLENIAVNVHSQQHHMHTLRCLLVNAMSTLKAEL